MPTRGYRKGVDDGKQPLPRQIYTRIAESEYEALQSEAAARCITVSRLVRTLIAAHIRRQRAELPQPRGITSAAIRELCRLGNNLNQLAKQANVGLVTVSEEALRACLDQINSAARRLG